MDRHFGHGQDARTIGQLEVAREVQHVPAADRAFSGRADQQSRRIGDQHPGQQALGQLQFQPRAVRIGRGKHIAACVQQRQCADQLGLAQGAAQQRTDGIAALPPHHQRRQVKQVVGADQQHVDGQEGAVESGIGHGGKAHHLRLSVGQRHAAHVAQHQGSRNTQHQQKSSGQRPDGHAQTRQRCRRHEGRCAGVPRRR